MNKDKTIHLPDCVVHNNVLYYPEDSEFYTRMVATPVTVMEKLPVLRWKGGKIPFTLVEQILAFFIHGFAKTGSENLIYLYYNHDLKSWLAWAPPQICSGMTVKADEKHADWESQRNSIPVGYVQMGTVHHHCTAGAFASGTDKQDEDGREGLHITVGNLDKDLSWHARAVVEDSTYTTDLMTWIAAPDQIPERYAKQVMAAAMTQPDKTVLFPEIWLDNCSKPTYRDQKPSDARPWYTQKDLQTPAQHELHKLGSYQQELPMPTNTFKFDDEIAKALDEYCNMNVVTHEEILWALNISTSFQSFVDYSDDTYDFWDHLTSSCLDCRFADVQFFAQSMTAKKMEEFFGVRA